MDDNNFDLSDLGFNIQPITESELENMDLEIIEAIDADSSLDSASAEQLENVNEALASQAAANEAIEVGDYEAAQHHRENAESSATEAGVDNVLEGPTSTDLEWADYHQDRAKELQDQQAEAAEAGEYELAEELSLEAANEMQTADDLAGGDDHSGQDQMDANNMDWASWHDQQADEMIESAIEYAAEGNLDAAENYLDGAVDQQAAADNYGDLGQHDGAVADYDPTSDIQSNSYDTYSSDASIDTNTTDDFSV